MHSLLTRQKMFCARRLSGLICCCYYSIFNGKLMNWTPVLLTAGAVLAYNAFAKGTALKNLNFYPSAVQSIRFDGVTPVLTLGLAIQNTSNQTLVLRSFAGNVFANDYLIGNVSGYNATPIPPNSQTIYYITVRLSLLGIVNDIVKAIQGNGLKQALQLDARANVDNYNIPVKIKYSVG